MATTRTRPFLCTALSSPRPRRRSPAQGGARRASCSCSGPCRSRLTPSLTARCAPTRRCLATPAPPTASPSPWRRRSDCNALPATRPCGSRRIRRCGRPARRPHPLRRSLRCACLRRTSTTVPRPPSCSSSPGCSSSRSSGRSTGCSRASSAPAFSMASLQHARIARSRLRACKVKLPRPVVHALSVCGEAEGSLVAPTDSLWGGATFLVEYTRDIAVRQRLPGASEARHGLSL
mmetsp:Transcript_47747/g.158217  ORF Transcript_47747/g.158217 Transcript_47747/m.158217 type:complete len:234 (-) Transcript_47747:19-720(-)